MNDTFKIKIIMLFILFMPVSALSQENNSTVLNKINWQRGPGIGDLGKIAEVRIPEGYVFADGDDTRLIMEEMHNPTNGTELGFLAPIEEDWFIVFEFNKTGYIKDDEKDTLDADKILKSLIEGTEAGNKERKKRGWAIMKIIGWESPPRYNPSTNNLEWGIKAVSEGSEVINWNTRLLGRNGVMKVTLVAAPESLYSTLPYYQSLISKFNYKTGNKYSEYKQGDKVAKYGLSALIVGGAAAVAAKTGILKYLWKGLVVAAIAAFAFLKNLFTRKKETESPDNYGG